MLTPILTLSFAFLLGPGDPPAEGRRPVPVAPAPGPASEELGSFANTFPRVPCAQAIVDAGTGNCIGASSTPVLGSLYPLSSNLYVGSTGDVGVGTTAPLANLHVDGPSGLRISDPTSITPANAWMTINPDVNVATLNPGATQIGAQITSRRSGHLLLDVLADDNGDSFAVRTDSNLNGIVDRIAMTIKTDGNVGIGTTTPDAALDVHGDVVQERVFDGLVKAAAHVNVDASFPTISRQFNNMPGGATITVTRLGVGIYEVDFGAAVSDRFYQATAGIAGPFTAEAGIITVTPRFGNVNALFCDVRNSFGQRSDLVDFYLTIF